MGTKLVGNVIFTVTTCHLWHGIPYKNNVLKCGNNGNKHLYVWSDAYSNIICPLKENKDKKRSRKKASIQPFKCPQLYLMTIGQFPFFQYYIQTNKRFKSCSQEYDFPWFPHLEIKMSKCFTVCSIITNSMGPRKYVYYNREH